LWLLETFVVIGLVLLAIWFVVKVLVVLAALAAVAVAAFLLWWAYLELRDRLRDWRRPPTH